MNDTDTNPPPVLEITDLHIHYGTGAGKVIAVNGVDLHIGPSETLGMVGESGSGKSTLAMAILRLTSPPGRIVAGEIRVNGKNIVSMEERALRRLRWRDASLIPQGSMNSLNPIMRVRDQISDVIKTHENGSAKRKIRQRVVELLDMVQLPARVSDMYPHELSGGMKQRVCIAMAIALSPSLIIADEPTSALDVVVQKVVAQTLLAVKRELNSSMIMIGHDMALQAHLVDKIAVMYAGNIVELAPVRELFARPLHPYTQHLIASVPSIAERKPLVVNEFRTPDVRIARPKPELREVSPGHLVAQTDGTDQYTGPETRTTDRREGVSRNV